MTLSAAPWRSVIVAISDGEMPTRGRLLPGWGWMERCVPAQTTRISATKAPTTARASLDLFSEPLLTGYKTGPATNQDWAGERSPAQSLNACYVGLTRS